MAFVVKTRVEGVEQALANLAGLSQTVRNQVLRKAINAGARIILKAARSAARVRTGQLKKSLGVKMRTYRGSGVVMAIIGPRTGYGIAGPLRRRQKFGGKVVATRIDPIYYAHLIELGHKIVRGGTLKKGTGRVVGAAPAYPFLRPALEQTRGEVAAAVSAKIGQGIDAAAARLKK